MLSEEKEDYEMPSQTGSTVELDPRKGDDDQGNMLPWLRRKLKDRKEHIFRKKTLYKRFPVLKWLPRYSANDVVPDLLAGITVGITAIPQGLAYATLAGLPPQYGLYSSYMGSFVYMLLGSTRAVTIGPSSILSLLVYDSVAEMGPGVAVLLAFLTGCASLLVGLFNFGFVVEFIAAPVIGGFTTAAALSTITTQIKSLLGLKFSANGFIETWTAVFEHIAETRVWDAVMGFSCIVALLLLRVTNKIKLGEKGKRTITQRYINRACWFLAASRNAIIMMLATTIAVCLSTPESEENPFILTGNITSGLPPFEPPPFLIENGNQTYTFTEICSNLGSTMFAIPLIAILESVGIAKSFAKGAKIDASQEMIAIGASNLLGSFVGSFPVTGSFSRTAINAGSGVRTPLGGIYTGALVLLSISILTPYFYFIPKSALAATIIAAMIFMIETHLVKLIWGTKKSDLIPLFVTFFVCLFISMELGILIGTAVNLAMLAYSTARPKIKIQKLHGYLLITPDRSLIFTCMDYFIPTVKKACVHHPGVPVIIDLQHSSFADFSTAYGVKNLAEDLTKKGQVVIVTRVQPHVLSVILGMKPPVYVHPDGTELNYLLKEIESMKTSIATIELPPVEGAHAVLAKEPFIEGIEFVSSTRIPID